MRRFWELEKWPLCKGYSLLKMVILGQKIKLPKTSKQRFYKHITDVLCKTRLQKALNMREMRRFWKLEKWPQCKGYSLRKMVNLGQKIKLPKTCQKRLYERITDVLCKKRLQKALNMRKMRRFWKLEKWPLCKMVTFGRLVQVILTSPTCMTVETDTNF